jgi:predicted metal-binding membrane protein
VKAIYRLIRAFAVGKAALEIFMNLTEGTSQRTSLERILKRDRFIVIGSLVFVCLASWLYILGGAGMDTPGMASSASSTMMMKLTWTPAYFVLMLAMWWVMMVAMMLPSAAPSVLLFATVNRKNRQQGQLYVPTGFFAAGYLIAWGGFSLVAVLIQWGLERLALLSPMMQTTSLYLGAALLIVAGLYQLTPLKHACLRHCRSPIDYLAHHWRQGSVGAFRMGLEHGLFCLGCCWVLMALLFYGGVMNLWWITGLALYVLIEKLAPLGPRFSRYTGGLLILWGVVVMAIGG